MKEVSDKNWLCPKCGSELNITSCDRCRREYQIDKKLSSICPLCFSSCIYHKNYRVCSNWNCPSWEIVENLVDDSLILKSRVNDRFTDTIYLNRDFNSNGTPVGYHHNFLDYPFYYNLINAVWYSRRKIDVRMIPAMPKSGLTLHTYGL